MPFNEKRAAPVDPPNQKESYTIDYKHAMLMVTLFVRKEEQSFFHGIRPKVRTREYVNIWKYFQ
ncbi:hypothetical protein GCM10008983_26220 [Lentibacillus halophilus]|uniref:Uncharacterized protein n=1 Tax=Lentibacillus halophilus TaxID=295065 RepID=A0ABP3JD64_9BACI